MQTNGSVLEALTQPSGNEVAVLLIIHVKQPSLDSIHIAARPVRIIIIIITIIIILGFGTGGNIFWKLPSALSRFFLKDDKLLVNFQFLVSNCSKIGTPAGNAVRRHCFCEWMCGNDIDESRLTCVALYPTKSHRAKLLENKIP